MKGELYLIRNKLNGKEYVGKTYKGIDVRYKEHWNESNKSKKRNRPLYKAFRKYGKDAFEIVSLGFFEEGELEKKESEEIIRRNTYHFGYNATLGGDGVRRIDIPDKEILDVYKENRSVQETAEKIGCCVDTVRAVLNSHNVRVYRFHEGHKAQFTPKIISADDKGLSFTFESVNGAAGFIQEVLDKTGCKKNSLMKNISRVVSGERKTYLGIRWKYFEPEHKRTL